MTPNPNQQLLAQGRKLEFPKPGIAETPAQRTARTVPVAWLQSLVDPAKNECVIGIEVVNAVIHGPIEFRGTAFTSYVVFVNCEFDSDVTFNFARFSRSLVLSGSRFCAKASFRAAQIADDLRMIGCVFDGESGFSDIHVGQLLNASGSRFGKTNFERIRVEKVALFRVIRRDDKLVPTQFGGELRFLDASIGVGVEFDGAQFSGDVDFTRLRIDGDAFFRAALHDDNLKEIQSDHPPITFGGRVSFASAKIGGNAVFRGARFTYKNQPEDADFWNVSFAEAEINGTASFENIVLAGSVYSTTFHDNVSFHRFRVHGNVWFSGVHFGGNATFERAAIGGSAVFRVWEARNSGSLPPYAVTFKKEAVFRDSQMHIADFQGAVFHGEANFVRMICTDGMFAGWLNRAGDALYVTRFHGKLLFQGASISGLFEFMNVECEKDVSFVEASFGTMHFIRPNTFSGHTVIGGTVDLRGMTYRRISCRWRSLLTDKMNPYDRRQYVEMERFYRSIGDDQEAGRIYVARRVEEARLMRTAWQRFASETRAAWLRRCIRLAPGRLLDGLQRYLLNYGVRPLRLLVLSLLFVGLGWFVFSRPDAVSPNDAKQPAAIIQLSRWQALRLSLRMFVPAVNIVSGKDWVLRPDRRSPIPYLTFDGYGTLHQIAGVILLPLGLAALAGLLIPGGDRKAG